MGFFQPPNSAWSSPSFYQVIETLLWAESALMIGTGLLVVSLRRLLDARSDWRLLREAALRAKIEHCLKTSSPLPKIPYFSRHASVIVPVIEQLDGERVDIDWLLLRSEITEKILRPQARKLASSIRWTKRSLAARCYDLDPKVEDEELIRKLLNDKVPLVRLMAVPSAVKLSTPSIVDQIISLMIDEARFVRNSFLEALRGAPPRMHDLIRVRLKNETDPFAQRVCLDLLSHVVNTNDLDLLISLSKTPHKEMRMAALRALSQLGSSSAASVLEKATQDSAWEIRALSVKLLGQLQHEPSLPKIAACLSDASWWVRMNSGLALRELGPKGIAALQEQFARDDRFARETAEYVLALPELEKAG